MNEKTAESNTLTYYIDLLCEKIDLHADAFIMRIGAIGVEDWERVEFLEHMMLKPIDYQIYYLAGKVQSLVTKGVAT